MMDIDRAKEILATLAEGADPTTGEVLPDNSVCNKGEIVRAFYAVLNHIDEKKQKRVFLQMPANLGLKMTRTCYFLLSKINVHAIIDS